jgi:hypothetical protein
METWMRKCLGLEEETEADIEYWQQITGEERVAHTIALVEEVARLSGQPCQGIAKVIRVIRLSDYEEGH